MKNKNKEKNPVGLQDPDRAAYMISWRDRHIEKQNELIKGYEQALSLMESLLAFALWQRADQVQGARVARIPKDELSAMLSRYTSEIQDGEKVFTVIFRPATEPRDGEEQGAG